VRKVALVPGVNPGSDVAYGVWRALTSRSAAPKKKSQTIIGPQIKKITATIKKLTNLSTGRLLF